ncbi:hypothetical protein ES703_104182 [subsurface metagenome]
MKWQKSEGKDSRVVMEAGWKPIKDYKTLEQRGGVYIFADDSEDVKYVGYASIPRMVAEIGNSISEEKGRYATQVRVLYTDSDSNTISLSKDLRIKYSPVHN